MSSIGLFTMLTMQIEGGPFHEFSVGMEIIERPNVDGYLWRATAAKTVSSIVRTMEGYTILANANGAEENYQDLIGTTVTIVDPLGTSWLNMLIEKVIVTSVKKPAMSSVAGLVYLVGAEWTVRRTA